jgi:excisionase family DNA binding protein
MQMDELPDIMTPAMIARYMRVGRAKVYEYLKIPFQNGGLPHFMTGAHMRIRKIDFVKWLDYQVAQTQKPKLKAVK